MARRFRQASPYLLILFGESNVQANLQSFPVENVALCCCCRKCAATSGDRRASSPSVLWATVSHSTTQTPSAVPFSAGQPV